MIDRAEQMREACAKVARDKARHVGYPAVAICNNIADVIEALPLPAEAVGEEALRWRCFHCDETFTDKSLAADHFGSLVNDTAACRIDGGLAFAFRRQQQELDRYRAEDTGMIREVYALSSRHESEKREWGDKEYAKGLADGRAENGAQSRPVCGEAKPIDMILHCPRCHLQHVDAPDDKTPDWTNPPHRSHLCHSCGFIWRPADVATNGVEKITTRGSKDSEPPNPPATTAGGEVELPSNLVTFDSEPEDWLELAWTEFDREPPDPQFVDTAKARRAILMVCQAARAAIAALSASPAQVVE